MRDALSFAAALLLILLRMFASLLGVSLLLLVIILLVTGCGDGEREARREGLRAEIDSLETELGLDIQRTGMAMERLAADPEMQKMARAMYPADLDSVGNLTLILEMLERGLTKWGCEEVGVVQAEWTAPTEGSVCFTYQARLTYWLTLPAHEIGWGTPQFARIPIPAYADSAAMQLAGVDSLIRMGPWSAPADTLRLELR